MQSKLNRMICNNAYNVYHSRQQFKLLNLLGKLDGQSTQFSSSATGKPSSAQKSSPPMKDLPKKPPSEEGGSVSGGTESRDSAKLQKSSQKEGRHLRAEKNKEDLVSKDTKANKVEDSKQRSSEVLKKLLSSEGKPVQEEGAPSTGRSAERKQRPSSGRLTGLRGELVSAGEKRHWSSGGEGGERTATDFTVASQRTGSGRTSGLRGEMISAPGTKSTESREFGRTTGLRGELTQQDDSLQDESRDFGDEGCGPRLLTAVLAKGYRPLLLGASGSDSCLLPEVTSGLGCEQARESSNDLVRGEEKGGGAAVEDRACE